MDPTLLRRSYDRSADRYDEMFAAQQRPKIEALFAALPRPLPTPVVDLGAGTGLVARFTDLAPICIDASMAMLSLCPAARRVQADMRSLPLPNASFRLAFAVTSLIDFEPALPAITELARILPAGGLAALSVLKIENIPSLRDALSRDGLTVLSRLDLGQDLGFICRRT